MSAVGLPKLRTGRVLVAAFRALADVHADDLVQTCPESTLSTQAAFASRRTVIDLDTADR